MDNWDDLRFLVALSKTGTMTAAAKHLGTNTATVSRRIERLSEQLGTPAFVKTSDGWKPSDAVLKLIEVSQAFDDFVGQEHVIGPGTVLRRAIESDQLPSIILWGPPGTGKTTLAYLVATTTKSHFSPVSAVGSGVADLRRIAAEAQERLMAGGVEDVHIIAALGLHRRMTPAELKHVLGHPEREGPKP